MFADMLMIIQHVEMFERKTHVFTYNIHMFLFLSYNWRAVIMFDMVRKSKNFSGVLSQN